jgi:hypothetical protein
MGTSTKWTPQQGTKLNNGNIDSSIWAEYENHPFQPGPAAKHQEAAPKQPLSCGRLTNLELHDLRNFDSIASHSTRTH